VLRVFGQKGGSGKHSYHVIDFLKEKKRKKKHDIVLMALAVRLVT